MTNFRAGESGKVLVTVSLLINVVLVVVIVWLLMKPSVGLLVPSSGKTDYLVAVNAQNEPRIYTAEGIPWEFCKEGQCKDIPTDISCESPDQDGFILVNFSRSNVGARSPNKAAAMSDMIISPAIAQQTDGDCPKIGYKKFFGAWIAQYPPTSVDPDCPPK